MKMNPEESIPKEYPDDESTEGEKQGYSVVINCNADSTHDVVRMPLQPVDEGSYPDGLFGLRSLEDALRGVIALKDEAPAYESGMQKDMMEEFEK